ncbi:P-loop containing nucleoside triphosphate hydrolase [Pseudocohnilembus persalinus]|uniref:p-loop containing nucleoside triphosphate hydrolase n=1 Tax=Pseudocohnilembus persalinus TaxID=266149 RepID=A0A0V0QVM2_PSEPJ|nr:P-loop containing nucleoside triphosphate hydrolase [Pseudocohnilembus persalinus]|eukprot:KRX06260.1 P-loop containing nucleoside triphosphate hydrolase [Pseudocohnilembus persalinus]
MGESVVSEYVYVGSNIMKSPTQIQNSNYYYNNESEESSEIEYEYDDQQNQDEEKKTNRVFIKNVSKKSQKKKKKDQLDDNNSQKTTSEMNALNNIIEKEKRKPIYFNMMVAGESGVGKSTFVDLFLSKKFKKQETIRPQTQQITENKGQRKEGNIDFNINIIDTPGYSQGTNLKAWYQDLRNYIIQQYENYQSYQYKQLENHFSNQDRQQFQQTAEGDSRIHLCLYFLQGPRIKQTDIKMMKKLQKYVNIIPILAKGDSYNQEEIIEIKQNLIKEAQTKQIHWFNIKETLRGNPEYLKKIKEGPHGEAPPFLIITSSKKIEVKPNTFAFGRNYKWGQVNLQDPDHSDFNLLYTLLIGHLSVDLINNTNYFFLQYCKQKSDDEQQLVKKEEDSRNLILIGTIATLSLAVTSFFMKYKQK